ncbi:uncharacterized mitochondrial protein AtMg00310-like [Carya illinoinensis]|uniref:uncharacterized mitochondrial protein AtMg00310-like n=1 Tax=Carya illinoinensis TaxID=32201 RepID=UPI001C71E99E|nr:uncharacterized mitochondrial protein AtMg00310-like [Carya illinoinensis]
MLRNWNTKYLSQVGKEILLKAIVQAIPTYSMGLFKLPKLLLQTLNKVMSRYWWGKQAQENKIHWVSWHQMRRAMKIGGLGFKDFDNFNTVLLAKQGWGLIQNPYSLLAQVVRAKYFLATNFLKAKLGSSPSYIWQSILSTRPLLEDGLLWRIGNGEAISIWTDKWLPQHTTFKPQSSIRFLQVDTKVSNLIDSDTYQWNESLVNVIFSREETKIIKAIPISHCNRPNKRIWRCIVKGNFIVKSAYHLCKELQDRDKCQSTF